MFRTDLALEAKEMYHEKTSDITEIDGVKATTKEVEGVLITHVNILNENGYWQVGVGDNTPEIEIVFDSQIIADKIVLKENIATGQQIESFGIFADNGKGYKKICSSTVIGAKRICRFKKQKINRIKIVITSYRVKATLNSVEIYCKK